MSIDEQHESPAVDGEARPARVSDPGLDERYGRTSGNTRRNRLIFISAGVGLVVVLIAWLVWGGLLGAPAQLEARDTGHVIVDENTTLVRFELNVPPQTETKCAVQALNEGFSVVGWKIIDVPASEERVRSFSEEVRTTELAVTGLIYRCWLA